MKNNLKENYNSNVCSKSENQEEEENAEEEEETIRKLDTDEKIEARKILVEKQKVA